MFFHPLLLEVPYHNALLLMLSLALATAMPAQAPLDEMSPCACCSQERTLCFCRLPAPVYVRYFYRRNAWTFYAHTLGTYIWLHT